MKRAIIVGASSGMGLEVAKLLLADGWKIGIAARRVDMLNSVKAENEEMVEVAQIDVTQSDAPERLLDLIERMGGVDLYFHASGIGKQNLELDAEVELNTVETNAMGFTRMVDAVFRYMADNGGGRIAVISSIAGTKGLGPAPSYSATKAFQNIYIEALEQLSNSRKLGISFTDIRPGFVDTALLSGGNYPMLMRPERVARSIVKATYAHRHVKIIDFRYRILVFFWRLIPRFIWRRLRLV
ncbi:MAG: SDR family NAD(P)-dependent oxidoreductase [Prevotella sp.]|nr:SDR family NAD(P)-dependent oxidoreductase [Prevotella sp.]